MAAKESDSGAIKKQELDDMTTCCICTEVYTDPKALPCIHTFCMKCIQENGLKTSKRPGDEMPCPICRRLFKIPSEGFCGLPKNFFIANLIQVTNVSDQSAIPIAVCDACLDEKKEKAGKEIPAADHAADAYCVECKYKLCEKCRNEHRKFRFTKNHKLVQITEHEGGQNVIANLASSVCEQHEQNVQNVYCSDCKTVVCAICFIDDHSNHKGSHVNKFVDGFRKQIDGNAEVINQCRSQAETKKAKLLELKKDIQGRVGTLECVIDNRKEKLKQLTDKHASSILHGLCSTRQSKLKEIQIETDDIDEYLSLLETYNSYCQKITAKGSASDICRSFSDLSVRAVKLKQQCQLMIEREIQSFNLCFRKSELEEILEANCENWIGEIEEEGDLKPKKRGKQSLLAEQSKEIDLLRKKNTKLKQELEATKTDSENKILNLKEKLNQEKSEKEQPIIVQAELKRRLKDKLLYKTDPVLVQTIRTKAAEQKKKATNGLAILDKELYVVSNESSEVEVYDLIKLSFNRRWKLKELTDPWDIGSCNRNKCLYISNCKGFYKSSEILRVDPNGNLIMKWSTGDDWGYGLSVTNESNVILTVYEKNKLNEYSPDGRLVREVDLSSNAGIRHPNHALKLPDGHFVVSHGYDHDELHRVCVVDAYGKLKMSFGGKCGSNIGQMNYPIHFSVDGNGCVMVANQENRQLLLLDPDLKFKREILPNAEKHGLRYPARILLDESNDRVFVADNGLHSETKRILIDGRILIFDFN